MTIGRGDPTGRNRATADLDAEAVRDLALLRQLTGGDATAFAEIVTRHLPLALAIARRMLRDDAEAEDVAQEAMLRLWRTVDRLEVGPGGLRPWLRRVVANLCIDRTRARRHTDVTDELPEQPQPATQVVRLVAADRASRVDAALKLLPDRQRLALVLFHYEGLSQIEVAGVLGVSDEAVESLLARARRALRMNLAADWRELIEGDSDG